MAKKRSAYINLASKALASVQEWLENFGGSGYADLREIPQPEKFDKDDYPSKVKDFLFALFEESYQARSKSFGLRLGSASGDGKDSATSTSISGPAQFWLNCRRLENGNHWDVWGSRYSKPGDEWKAELVDDEIGNQVRVKKAHLLGAWHNLTVFPNIQNIDQILYWERVYTGYQNMLNTVLSQGLTEGTVFAETFYNTDIGRDGYIDELVLDNEGVLLTPGARGIEVKDGNWYFMHCCYLPKRYVVSKYGLEDVSLTSYTQDFYKKITPVGDIIQMQDTFNFSWNQDVPCMKLYFDDYAMEPIPFDQMEVDTENAVMSHPTEADIPEPLTEQNHRRHVKAHIEFLQQLEDTLNGKEGELTPKEVIEYETIVQRVQAHIQLHKEAAELYEQYTGYKAGTRRKYPHGRFILWIGGQLVYDDPVEFGFDWRLKFHKYTPEEKAKEVWGRGIPESLWNTNKNLDLMLSRIADVALLHGMPKTFYDIANKDMHKDPEAGPTNDPQEPEYFVGQPPVFRQAQASQDNYQIYNSMKVNAEKKGGVNDVSYGESPTKQASAELADSLMQQNQILVTGEPNQNLDLFVTSTIRARLLMMRVYYKKPRVYEIDGKFQVVNVKKILSTFTQTDENGQPEEIPIPEFLVEVKGGSNLANQWEADLSRLVAMASQPLADGAPIIPREAVLDHLAERYPKFAVGAQYYQMSQATQIGLRVMAEQQKKAEEEQKLQDSVEKKIINKGMSAAIS